MITVERRLTDHFSLEYVAYRDGEEMFYIPIDLLGFASEITLSRYDKALAWVRLYEYYIQQSKLLPEDDNAIYQAIILISRMHEEILLETK